MTDKTISNIMASYTANLIHVSWHRIKGFT